MTAHDKKIVEDVKHVKALLVEDDRTYNMLLEEYLSGIGGLAVDKTFSSDIKEALQIFTKEKPDIVLLDIGLSGANGLELIKPMLDAHLAAGIIMVTGSPFAADIEAARSLGAIGYIFKPYNKRTVVNALLTYLDYAQTLDSLAENLPIPQAAQEAREKTEFFIPQNH